MRVATAILLDTLLGNIGDIFLTPKRKNMRKHLVSSLIPQFLEPISQLFHKEWTPPALKSSRNGPGHVVRLLGHHIFSAGYPSCSVGSFRSNAVDYPDFSTPGLLKQVLLWDFVGINPLELASLHQGWNSHTVHTPPSRSSRDNRSMNS